MPASDIIHLPVRNALVKDGWTITDDPLTIAYKEMTVFADLAAERILAAERAEQKIVVEVKSFTKRSPVHDLEIALGQYVLYKGLLAAVAPEKELYIAVSQKIYATLFQQQAVQQILSVYPVFIIVVDVPKEEIVQWVK